MIFALLLSVLLAAFTRHLGGNFALTLDHFRIIPQSGWYSIRFYAFIASCKTLGAIIFIISPGNKVLSADVFEATVRGDVGDAAALSVVIMLVATGGGSYLSLIERSVGGPAAHRHKRDSAMKPAVKPTVEPATMAVLSIRNLRVSFGDEVVLLGLNLEIAPGEFCCLLGPSGCGKTTLLKTIAGFIRPSSSAIFLEEREITHRPPQKRDVGMVFQNYALFPHLSVFDNIAYGLKRRRVKPAVIERRVEDILKTIGLATFAERRIGALSGGQQQRVALARILVLSPRLLLFDEPLSNLDAKLRVSLREEIREIQARTGVPALFVTHDQEEALQMGHRIAVMEAGRLVQEGSPREIYEKPTTLFVADFIGTTNRVPARRREAPGSTRTRS